MASDNLHEVINAVIRQLNSMLINTLEIPALITNDSDLHTLKKLIIQQLLVQLELIEKNPLEEQYSIPKDSVGEKIYNFFTKRWKKTMSYITRDVLDDLDTLFQQNDNDPLLAQKRQAINELKQALTPHLKPLKLKSIQQISDVTSVKKLVINDLKQHLNQLLQLLEEDDKRLSFSKQYMLLSGGDTSNHKPSAKITIEIDLEDIEQNALYGIPLRFDTLDTDEDTDTITTSTDTDTSQPISPPPAILHTTPSISSTPLHPPIPDHNTRLQDRDSSTTQRDTVPPPIINTVVLPPAPILAPISHIPRVNHTPITTTQDIASSSTSSNFLPPYLQRQMQQEKIGNKIININLIEYLHNKERKKSAKFNNILNNNQQLHKDKYFTGENSQVSKFNENAANIYKNVQVGNIASQQFFEVSNTIDSKVKVSLVEKSNTSKLIIQSQSDNSTDLMLSITMETKKQLGLKANMKIYIEENTNEKYIKELTELLAKSISLGLNIQLLPPKNHLHPEQYSSTIKSVINNARATAPNIDPRLLSINPSFNRR